MLETAIAAGSKRPAIALDTSMSARTVCPQRSAGLYEAHPGLGRLTWSSALAMYNALPCGVNAPALTFVVPTSTPIRQAFSDIISRIGAFNDAGGIYTGDACSSPGAAPVVIATTSDMVHRCGVVRSARGPTR